MTRFGFRMFQICTGIVVIAITIIVINNPMRNGDSS